MRSGSPGWGAKMDCSQAVRRGGVLLLVLGLGLVAVAARLVQLQIVEHETWAEAASRIQEQVVELPARRGTLYGADGRALAKDVPGYALALDNHHMTRPELLVELLREELEFTRAEAEDKVYRSSYFTWLSRQLDLELGDRLRARARELGIRGFLFFDSWIRVYPQGPIALPVLGTVGVDGQGLAGLELVHEESLAGRPGVYRVLRGRDGQVYSLDVADSGAAGEDLKLTLDPDIQRISEEEIAAGVEKYNAERGFAIVLNPQNGELLALAQAPTFDPEQADANPDHLQPWAVTQMFEPGSTFKALAGLAAMDAGLVQPDDVFHADSPIMVMGVPLRNANPSVNYGPVTFERGLAQSLNVVFVQVGQRLGIDSMYSYLTKMGLGQPTGIGLPGEAAGILRPVEEWTELQLATSSYGQGVAVTGVQLAAAFGVLAGDGLLHQAHVVQGAGGEPVARVASPEAAYEMRAILRKAVDPSRWVLPSRFADVPGYGIAGKSGTGEKARPGEGYVSGHYISGFGAFFPWEQPEYVVLVVYDEIDASEGMARVWGAHSAGPTVARIVEGMDAAGVVSPYEPTTDEGRSG
ncbi:MAG: penicillin-binding protein 2 [Candidatus Bipolaricaulota bacterium]